MKVAIKIEQLNEDGTVFRTFNRLVEERHLTVTLRKHPARIQHGQDPGNDKR